MPTQPLAAQPLAADCEAHPVRLDAPLDPEWSERLADVCHQLAQRADLDQSVNLEVNPGPDSGLTIRARLRDGRSATRYVDTTETLALTLAALLVLPKTNEPPAVARQDAAVSGSELHVAPTEPEPPHANAANESFLHVGFGVGVIGHIFAAPSYAAGGFVARVSVRLGPVLLDLTPRWEAEQGSVPGGTPDFEMHNLGVGAGLGARVWSADEGALETGAGILILEETQTYRESVKELAFARVSAQLSAYARLLWGGSALRWTIGLEANLAPSRLAHSTHLRDILPALPFFGIGLTFGVHWESE